MFGRATIRLGLAHILVVFILCYLYCLVKIFKIYSGVLLYLV